MDHRYIDDHSVAQRYLDHTLSPGERSRFEAHLVDCQECTDRVLLAEMFQSRNGQALPKPHVAPSGHEPGGRLRYVISFTPGQLFWVRAGGAALTVVTLILIGWALLSAH